MLYVAFYYVTSASYSVLAPSVSLEQGIKGWRSWLPLTTMLPTGSAWKQADSSREPGASTPVSRTQRLQRLEKNTSKGPETPEERLRRLARRVDTWTESRSDKSIWQSWMCTCIFLTQPLHPRRASH